jgi:ketopantoate reductase
MKICIYGAGAIGGYLGVLLKQGGADVSLIARGAHLEAIKANGLKLVIAGGNHVAHMPATSDPAELGPQDYVIVALKSHQAWEVAAQMQPLLGPDTAVVPGGISTVSRASSRTCSCRALTPMADSGTPWGQSAPLDARFIRPRR